MLYCLIVAVLFCIGNLLNSRQRKSFFGVVKEGRSRTIKVSSGYSSIKAYQCFFGLGAPASVKCFDVNSMRWLGLFTNKTFRKHRKLIFPHRDFTICIVSLAIFHPHFVIRTLSIRIFPSAFYHPQFSIRILSSAFFYPPSAIRRHPVRTLQRPDGGWRMADRTSETISDSAECYAGLSVRFESSAACF